MKRPVRSTRTGRSSGRSQTPGRGGKEHEQPASPALKRSGKGPTPEQALEWSELRYRRLFETAQDGILILDPDTSTITDANPYLLELLGYTLDEVLHKHLCEIGPFEDVEACNLAFEKLRKEGYLRYDNLPLRARDGHLVQVEFVSNVYRVGDEKVIQCNIRDITDRKLAEAALWAREKEHWLLFEHLPVGVVVHAADSSIRLCNPEASLLLGFTPDQMLGRDADDPAWHFLREDGTPMPARELPVNRVATSGEVLKNFIMGLDSGESEDHWMLVNAYPLYGEEDQLRQVVVTYADISSLKRAEKRVRRQVEYLKALSEIDRAITSSFDMRISLSTLLTHLLAQLRVDAAGVLLFKPTSQTLEYAAGRGFHTTGYEQSKLRLGEGYAGVAALEREIVNVPDLNESGEDLFSKRELAEENFTSYFGVPLIAKGEVKGVLEIFHRTHLGRHEDWFEYLGALAEQAAIAIDNALMFDHLQRSNTELALAYDATIEGWSRALDMRDRETEGHSQRVTNITVELARGFGMTEAELVHVRWGALLHDIGKMGIPDGILLKPGKLTEEEWEVMKRHPILAYEMLAPIRYLRSALDIPYHHHERWDGSGYPFGLKGEQIPLAARIFSVVDAWDALRSDRPYRDTWPVKKVRAHLRSLAGIHFDPQVVRVFLSSKVLQAI
ncbi:HD domain-containing phosphohydrolase [Geobacter sp. SVR]|uniref:HD domain-containing phosphohydrolase n=1 Tax=Geobacter sp. SVR TaxID=2495594 RepID=UPI00143EFFAE|nr:HD domain-containing phosphohydrolase [Geobacter sp. SVR]BCS54816.1 hypothetical protein GSVR_31240 [Geobacter sp. SVR]GCF86376.1 hypothetical protein GSbR_29760 [Geobacter sp. SVR]